MHHLEQHVCFWCECPKNKLGGFVPPHKQHPSCEHNLYRMLSDTNTKADYAEPLSRHVQRRFNLFQHIPWIVSDHLKPNLLHSMQRGLPDHPKKSISHCMKTHKRIDKYNPIWVSVPAYHNLTPKAKSNEEVSQRNGKEMKEMSRYLLGVVTQSLRGGSPTQRPLVNRSIQCMQAL